MKTDEIMALVAATRAILRRDQRNTCSHDETYRGGSIWEICRSCGQKWSDDRDPKPEWVDPPEWEAAHTAIDAIEAALKEREAQPKAQPMHGLDTEREVFFYEQDFYVLSNFSSFNLRWCGKVFPTSEHAYHWEKFRNGRDGESDNDRFQRSSIASFMEAAPSAHEAFSIANHWKNYRRSDWDEVKVGIMEMILRAKAGQHEYVRRKLLTTGDRTLIENSWRDDYWGWGPNRDGKNMLGRLWMKVREELRAAERHHKIGD